MTTRKLGTEHRRIKTLFHNACALLRISSTLHPARSATRERHLRHPQPARKNHACGRDARARRGIRQRLFDHLQGRSAFTKRRFKYRGYMLRSGYKFRYLIVENPRDRALLEPYAIGCLCPAFIGYGDVAEGAK
jgi:hypothetical protein